MAENTVAWETRPLTVKQWRKFNSRWFQLVVVDKLGNEHKFIMKEVKEFKGEDDSSSF